MPLRELNVFPKFPDLERNEKRTEQFMRVLYYKEKCDGFDDYWYNPCEYTDNPDELTKYENGFRTCHFYRNKFQKENMEKEDDGHRYKREQMEKYAGDCRSRQPFYEFEHPMNYAAQKRLQNRRSKSKRKSKRQSKSKRKTKRRSKSKRRSIRK